MKYVYLLLLCFCAISLTAQNLKLKIPTDYYYARTPKQNKLIKFNIKNKLTAINLISTDNKNSQRVPKESTSRRGKGLRSILVAIPKLYQIDNENDGKVYRFGKNGGENNNDDATVRVRYQQTSASTIKESNQRPVIFSVENSEIHLAKNGNSNFLGTQSFLKVQASKTSSATIEINRKSEQGNCIVAIFNSKNGNFLGALNPKDPDNNAATLSFTVDTDVHVVPLIRPKVTSTNGIDSIVFEVGDPEENGSATSEEE